MNPAIKQLEHFELRQKLAGFGVQIMGNVVSVGVIVFLVSAWALTTPFIQLHDQFARTAKVKNK